MANLKTLLIVPSVLFICACTTMLDIQNCDPRWEEKLATTVGYMNAASESELFDQCLRLGVIGRSVDELHPAWCGDATETLILDEGRAPVCFDSFWGVHNTPGYLLPNFISDEHDKVGAYIPCEDGLEPAQAYDSHAFGYEAVKWVLNLNPNTLELVCSNSDRSTAWIDDTDFFGYQHTNTERVYLGTRTRLRHATHDQGGGVIGLGPGYDFSDLHPSYEVDELGGIILHERLHTHGFRHGNSAANACGYDAYRCEDTAHPLHASCRRNSLPEIAEACMSMTIEISTGACFTHTCPADQLPIYDHPTLPGGGWPQLNNSDKCRCVNKRVDLQ